MWRNFTSFLRNLTAVLVSFDEWERIKPYPQSLTWTHNDMTANINRASEYDAVTGLETYSTEISFSYLDGVDENSTREVKMYAESDVSQEAADAAAAAELRSRILVMTDYLDSQFA